MSGEFSEGQVLLTAEELALAVGVRRTWVVRLVRLGVIEPAAPGESMFSAATAARLRKMIRLHTDLGVNLSGAAILVDLLSERDRLRAEIASLRKR